MHPPNKHVANPRTLDLIFTRWLPRRLRLLTGKKPYEADTALGMMVRHMNDPIPSARKLMPTLPAAVDAAIVSGMAKLPQDRPRAAGDFALNVRRGASTDVVEEPIKVAVTTVDEKPHRSSRRLLIGAGLVGGVLFLVGLGILGGGSGWLVCLSDGGGDGQQAGTHGERPPQLQRPSRYRLPTSSPIP